jgi:hypothetical protein
LVKTRLNSFGKDDETLDPTAFHALLCSACLDSSAANWGGVMMAVPPVSVERDRDELPTSGGGAEACIACGEVVSFEECDEDSFETEVDEAMADDWALRVNGEGSLVDPVERSKVERWLDSWRWYAATEGEDSGFALELGILRG